MRVSYQRRDDVEGVVRALGRLGPRTIVVDVEPMIAAWDSGQSSLSRGVACFLERASSVPGLSVICFATNSRRRLASAIGSSVIGGDGQAVRYIASAGKPLRTAHYREFPRPGVVIGDQVATDGALAWRLGYSFIHYYPDTSIPLGPMLMRYLGYSLRPFLFEPGGSPS
jgi:predicted HAD superfamily phosphohydrolase YqeG